MKIKYLVNIYFLLITTVIFAQDTVSQKGLASYYSEKFEGRITASGEVYESSKLTAAHPVLPFGTFVKVTNIENNKSVLVTINDRGPYTGNRIIDLSKKAAQKLEFIDTGFAEVHIEVVESVIDVNEEEFTSSIEEKK